MLYANEFLNLLAILKKEVTKWEAPVVKLAEATPQDPFSILITTLLSLRSRDEVTILVVKELFQKVRNPIDLIQMPREYLESIIYKIGFYKQKAKTLQNVSQIIVDQFENKVPDQLEQLISIKGVGRKTANIVLEKAFHQPTIAVDIHVHRISHRLGFIHGKTPYDTECAFMEKIPDQKYWKDINFLLVALGQTFCKPISPICSACPVSQYCEKVDVLMFR